jgi:hypothetical protein
MIYKIICSQGKARYYENEKTFLRYYKQFQTEYEKYKHCPGVKKVQAFTINQDWEKYSNGNH